MKVMGRATPADTQVVSVPGDVGQTPWSQRVRSLLLGPHGGGTTRRRASDAVRVGIAVVLVVICVPLAQANTSVEVHVAELLTPPPSGIRWLITALWFVGSIGVTVALVLIGLLVPRLTAVRQMAVAGVAALVVCLLLDALLGPAAGRPPVPDLSGFDPRFPVLQLAIATAVALAGLPYLSRPMHRLVVGAVSISALCAVVGAYGLPLGVIAAVVVGWGTAAACHLAMGAPNGLPSATEVTAAVRDLQVDVRGLSSMPRQEWGVAAFAGTDADGHPVELAVYGRDAADAQWLRKVWRFCIYRDSGPTLVFNRLQQVEHEAYLTFLAAHAGTLVPEIVAAGRCGPAHDAALVTRLPAGRRLSQLPARRGVRRRRRRLPPLRARAAPAPGSRTARSAPRRSSPHPKAHCCATSGAPRRRPPRCGPTATWLPRWPPPRSWSASSAPSPRPAGCSTPRRSRPS